MSPQVPCGWYESLLTPALRAALPPGLASELVAQEEIGATELRGFLVLHLHKFLLAALEDRTVEDQIGLTTRLLEQLADRTDALRQEIPLLREDQQQPLALLLRAVLDPRQHQGADLDKLLAARLPRSGFTYSELFAGSQRSLSLDEELRREIATASSVEILVSFIRWSGLRLMLKTLREAGERGVPIRVLTTSYLGATEEKAVTELARLPGVEVRVSYNHQRGRLHAKGWIFGRPRELGTAYVGSSNLSRDALQDGLEWNLKVTERQNGLLHKRIADAFAGLWQDPEFERFDPVQDVPRLQEALRSAKACRDTVPLRDLPPELQEQVRRHLSGNHGGGEGTPARHLGRLRPFPFQEEIQERLLAERELHGRWRNLVVLPTGSGKTMVAAFDYARLCAESGRRPRLLFVAHRRELLEQARTAFARVLGEPDFGALWVGDERPLEWTHVFASIQIIQSNRDMFVQRWPSMDWFEHVVVDEAHHGGAESYRFLLRELKPRCLLGLTATPERMDGQHIADDFDGVFAAEMRLHDGIAKDLLCPFHYFGVADGMPDLSEVQWRSGRYVQNDLERFVLDEGYVRSVLRALERIVADPHRVRTLGFCCTRRHAAFMADRFSAAGLRAAVLTGDSSEAERRAVLLDLEQGRTQYLFSVDLFNEGLDIPSVDTVLFLRPTESLTVFLQQLGRGLRHHPGKQVLTVLDFVSQANKDYDFTHKFTAMLGEAGRHLDAQARDGYPGLPPGCAIQLERKAEEMILQHIKRQIPSSRLKMLACARASGARTVEEFLRLQAVVPEQMLQYGGLWYQMQRDLSGKEEESLCRFVRDIILQATSTHQLDIWAQAVEAGGPFVADAPCDWLCQEWRAYASGVWQDPATMWAWLLADAERRGEVLWWLRHQQDRTEVLERPLEPPLAQGPHLRLFAAYTQKGIKWTLGRATWGKPDVSQAGVERLTDQDGATQAWLLYVTIRKSEQEFSRNTLYQDWALTHELFQWESPNKWVPHKDQGQRFLDEAQNGVPVLLFVRESRKEAWNRRLPYTFLGPVTLVPGSPTGERPIGMQFRLAQPMPTAFFRRVCLEMVA